MSTKRKIIIAILILAALAAVALLVILPRIADVDRYRPRVISVLEQQTGRSIEIGHLTLAILPALSIRADDVSVRNPPGFPQAHFLEIHTLYADLDFTSLLQRRLVIKSLELDEPAVNLLTDASGRWNSETPRPVRMRPVGWVENPAQPPVIGKVQLNHGRATYANVSSSGQAMPISFEAANISAELHDVNPAALGVNLNPAPVRPLGQRWGGTAWPLAWAPPMPAILQVSWAQPAADGTQTSVSPRGMLAARGTVTAQSARFGSVETGGFKSDVEVYSSGVRLSAMSIELWGGKVTGDLVLDSGSQPPQYGTYIALSGIDAARLLMALPNAGGKLTGTIEGRLDLQGSSTPPAASAATSGNPLAYTQGTGELTVRNGTLPELHLNSDMKQLLKNIVRTGSASTDPSSFRSISADLEIAGGGIRSRQITILGNGIEMDLNGTLAMEGAGQLNYQGVGKIDVQRNGYSSVLAGVLGAKIAGGRITFPFTLTGSLGSPRFEIKNSPWFH